MTAEIEAKVARILSLLKKRKDVYPKLVKVFNKLDKLDDPRSAYHMLVCQILDDYDEYLLKQSRLKP